MFTYYYLFFLFSVLDFPYELLDDLSCDSEVRDRLDCSEIRLYLKKFFDIMSFFSKLKERKTCVDTFF